MAEKRTKEPSKHARRVAARNDIAPLSLFKRRTLRLTAVVWLAFFVVMVAGTIATIQAGPFGLSLEVNIDKTPDGTAYAILGGFMIAWAALAFVPATLFYQIRVKDFAAKRRPPAPSASAGV